MSIPSAIERISIASSWARVPSGERIYAIGDVHGRVDLLDEIIAMIRADNDRRAPADVTLILLGDLVDRGPDSAAVVSFCQSIVCRSDRFIVLKGNHEAAMVLALRGKNKRTLAAWLQMGGDITLQSWGVDARSIDDGASSKLMREARRAVSKDVLRWLASLPLSHRAGDYLFVHAGIRPAVKLSRQREDDLLWIGDTFLESDVDHGMIVIHGHTITPDGPAIRENRIGIDTGAFYTDRLTALVLEDRVVEVLTTRKGENGATC
jgi:serine/threonine protein phosphatase 1